MNQNQLGFPYEEETTCLVIRLKNENKWLQIREYSTHTGQHVSITEVDSPLKATRVSGYYEILRLFRSKPHLDAEYGDRVFCEEYFVHTYMQWKDSACKP